MITATAAHSASSAQLLYPPPAQVTPVTAMTAMTAIHPCTPAVGPDCVKVTVPVGLTPSQSQLVKVTVPVGLTPSQSQVVNLTPPMTLALPKFSPSSNSCDSREAIRGQRFSTSFLFPSPHVHSPHLKEIPHANWC